MCTLTFVPTEDGYLAGMNRDELFSRPRALPPKIFVKGAMEMVYPPEPFGGTWIACNSQGNLLALLNWNGNESYNLGEKRRTRGLVIPELAGESDLPATDSNFPVLANIGFHRVSQIRLQKKSGVGRAKLQRASPPLGAMAGFAAFIARTFPDQAPSRFVSTGRMRRPSVTPRYAVAERRSRWITSTGIPA